MSKYLIVSDIHLRSTVPSCIDATPEEWIDIQKQALYKVVRIANDNGINFILCCGDLFHSEQTASFECIQLAQNWVQDFHNCEMDFYICAGNHDLPLHSSSNLYRSAIGVFLNSEYVHLMEYPSKKQFVGSNFDVELSSQDCFDYEILCKHVLCIPKENIPAELMDCETPESLLKKYPNKFICLGDYHRNFHFEKNGRHVINPGCLTKQAADFEEYETGVYCFDTETDEVKWCPVNIEQKFNHNGYEKKALDQTIENFVEGIKAEDVTLDYISSLRNEAKNHDKGIQNKINDWIEQSGN
jgi:DNA repair exonuclease SbcCD nuclease subunit